MELDHKQQIQEDVQHAGEDQKVQRPLRIPHGPQDAAAHVIQKQARDAGKIDAQIQGSLVEYVRRGLHKAQHEVRTAQKAHGKQQAQDKGHGHDGLHGRVQQLVIFGPEVFADDHRAADGEPVEEEYAHIGDHGGGTDGGQGLGAHEVTHHDGVNRVVQHLEHVADHQRQGKFQQQPRNIAPGHVLCFRLCHGISCLSVSLHSYN